MTKRFIRGVARKSPIFYGLKKITPMRKPFRLETNYRSTGHILNTASVLIDHNQGRMGKESASRWRSMGEKIRLCQFFSGDEEAQFCCRQEVESLAMKKVPFDDMAVLVRTGAQTRAFEESLLRLQAFQLSNYWWFAFL